MVGSHVSLAWVELLVLGALVGETHWSPTTSWVELLVLETWLDKHSGALDSKDRDRSGDSFGDV